jgi:hypothetical protein
MHATANNAPPKINWLILKPSFLFAQSLPAQCRRLHRHERPHQPDPEPWTQGDRKGHTSLLFSRMYPPTDALSCRLLPQSKSGSARIPECLSSSGATIPPNSRLVLFADFTIERGVGLFRAAWRAIPRPDARAGHRRAGATARAASVDGRLRRRAGRTGRRTSRRGQASSTTRNRVRGG